MVKNAPENNTAVYSSKFAKAFELEKSGVDVFNRLFACGALSIYIPGYYDLNVHIRVKNYEEELEKIINSPVIMQVASEPKPELKIQVIPGNGIYRTYFFNRVLQYKVKTLENNEFEITEDEAIIVARHIVSIPGVTDVEMFFNRARVKDTKQVRPEVLEEDIIRMLTSTLPRS